MNGSTCTEERNAFSLSPSPIRLMSSAECLPGLHICLIAVSFNDNLTHSVISVYFMKWIFIQIIIRCNFIDF